MGTLADSTPAMMLKDYIVADGRLAAHFTGWAFKFGNMPSEPAQVIVLIDQSGPAGFPHLLVDNPGVQILVRSAVAGNGYQTSYLMARKLRDIVLGMPGHPPQFAELDGITERSTGPIPLGFDDKERHIWSMNYQLLVEPDANALTHRMSL